MAPSPDLRDLARNFVAASAPMLEVLALVDCYARAHTPLIIVGATGTGKTTVAELVHGLSGRAGPFRAFTAAEFDPELERSQLFGHERGAFTGAHDRRPGAFEQAGEGTLLLDDFHHLRRSTQTLLLRALDRGAFQPVGGTRDLPIRCRVMVGLTEMPEELVARGDLLAELRFRLGYSVIRLPALEERREDIPSLAQRFLLRCPAETGVQGPTRLAPEVIAVLQAAAWPGNVRQLEMVVRDAYLRAQGSAVVRLGYVTNLITLPLRFRRHGDASANARAIALALQVTGGRIGDAARLLGTSRTTVYAYLATRRETGATEDEDIAGA